MTECQSCFHFTTSLAPNSTDLNPLDYKINVDELKQRLINVWHRFEQQVINDAGDKWRKRLRVGIRVKVKNEQNF